MDEIRKNHIVLLKTKTGDTIDGIIFDYTNDRILVLIAFESLEEASKLQDLDELDVTVYTHLGAKKMYSAVIDGLKKNNCIIIENNESHPIEQKRQFVRVLSSAMFKIKKENKTFDGYCINISAGGIAFGVNNTVFEINDKIEMVFSADDFGKEIVADGQIIKIHKNTYVAKFMNLNTHDEDKIMKYVFRLIAKK